MIGYPQLAATSAEQGRLAARHAAGLDTPTISEQLPVGVYTIPEIAMIGQTEDDLTTAGLASAAHPVDSTRG